MAADTYRGYTAGTPRIFKHEGDWNNPPVTGELALSTLTDGQLTTLTDGELTTLTN